MPVIDISLTQHPDWLGKSKNLPSQMTIGTLSLTSPILALNRWSFENVTKTQTNSVHSFLNKLDQRNK